MLINNSIILTLIITIIHSAFSFVKIHDDSQESLVFSNVDTAYLAMVIYLLKDLYKPLYKMSLLDLEKQFNIVIIIMSIYVIIIIVLVAMLVLIFQGSNQVNNEYYYFLDILIIFLLFELTLFESPLSNIIVQVNITLNGYNIFVVIYYIIFRGIQHDYFRLGFNLGLFVTRSTLFILTINNKFVDLLIDFQRVREKKT